MKSGSSATATGPYGSSWAGPAEALPEGGDPEFEKLKAPKLLKGTAGPFARKPGFLEASLPASDVRIWDDSVFAPWDAQGKKEDLHATGSWRPNPPR